MKGGIRMTRYAFPAVFTPEEEGGYSVYFPDIEGCYTQGDDMAEALYMAEDALSLMLYEYESQGKPIPEPSALGDLKTSDTDIVNFVFADTLKYRKMHNNRSVKKTLSIPEWMNEAATAAGINFSQALQEIVLQKLNLNQ